MDKVLSCYWSIHLNGAELDQKRKNCISSVTIEEQCDGSNTVTLSLSDPEFLFIEDNIFIKEAKISVICGFNEDTYRDKFDGYISAIDLDFPEQGYPILSIFCLDGSHVMNRKKKKRSWDKVTRPNVVSKIAKEYGFKFVAEKGYAFEKEDTITQSGVTDIEFIESLAEEETQKFMCKLIGNTIYYVKKGLLAEPKMSVSYKKYPYDVVSFRPQINKETIQEEVKSSNIDSSSKKTEKGTASSSSTSRETQGQSVETYQFSGSSKSWKKE